MIKRSISILIWGLLFSSPSVLSQNHSIIPANAQSVLDARGEVYFEIFINEHTDLSALSAVLSIDRVDSLKVYAYANEKEFANFLSMDYSYNILPAPSMLHPPVMRSTNELKSIHTWDFYPTYGAYEMMMYQFEADYPTLCAVYELGTLNSGRKIIAAKITSNVSQPGNKPRFNYSSSMHGDELTGYVLMLRLIDYLLDNYGTDPRVTYLLDNIEIWITPLENPDGAYTNDNSTVAGATRNNANNVDLNRNYNNPVMANPDGNPWQEETIITMGYLDSMNFTLSANLHGGIECVNYPWDSWTSAVKTHADHNWWQFVSHEYADTARFYSPANYMNPSGPSFFNGVTHGGDWYAVRGSRQDYLNYFTHSREFTLEISNTKLPPASQLPLYWDYNYRSFLNYMEQSLYGLRGIVTDSCTGMPLRAEILLIGHDTDNSHVYSFLPLGNFHRPVLQGQYDVEISAPGYHSKIFHNISVTDYNTTVLNAELVPQAPAAVISADLTYSCNGFIQFDADIHNANSWEWHFDDGHSSTEIAPLHYYVNNGTYFPYLSVNNCIGTQNIPLPDSIVIDKPLPPVVHDDTLCHAGSTVLTATGPGLIKWYASLTDSIALDTGAVFETPVLNQTTSYYAASKIEMIDTVGESNSTTNGGMFTASPQHYLVFDCYRPARLKSVEVNAASAGPRTFYLRNSGGQNIDSVTVYVPAGVSRINMDLDIPAGNDLQLAGPPNPELFRSNAGLSYPYDIQGYISIKHSSVASDPTAYYYYFYNWEVLLEDCYSNRTEATVNIINMPVANFTYMVDSLTVNFTGTSFYANSFEWHFGDGAVSYLANPLHEYNAFGVYDVMLIVSNDCGSDTISETIELFDSPPIADFTVSTDTIFEGQSVQFFCQSLYNPNSWQWLFQGGTPPLSNLENPLVFYDTAGTYDVTLIVTNAFGSDTLTRSAYIHVKEGGLPPEVDFMASPLYVSTGDTVHFTDLSTHYPHTWLWHFEGGSPGTSTQQNPSVVYNTEGTYFVAMVASNDFGSGHEIKSAYIQVESVSVKEAMLPTADFKIYPNPVKDILYVTLPQHKDKLTALTVCITDVIGRTWQLEIQDTGTKNLISIDVQSLDAGVYTLRINDTLYRKFIIMR